MTEIGRNLKRLLDNSEKYKGNAKRLSLSSGLGPSAVSDIIGGKSEWPLVENLMKIAGELGCGVTEIDRTIDPVTGHRKDARPAAVRPGGTIPIRSGDSTVGYTQRSASLTGVPDAYGIYMVGNEMEPRYRQGWLLQVNPFRPPATGRDVVVRKVDGSIVVAEFVGRTPNRLVLKQLNPAEEIRISLGDVQDVHLIVSADQEGG